MLMKERVGELVASLREYFRAEDLVSHEVRKDGSTRKVVGDVPNVPEWCYENGLTKGEFAQLCSESSEFQREVELCMCRLEGLLVKHGLVDRLNGGMAGLTLKNWFGWRDRVESDITSGGDKVESVTFYLPSNGRDIKVISERVE